MLDQMFVYVIGPDDGPFKIGVTKDMAKRFVGIQHGSPLPLRVWYLYEVPDDEDAFSIENRAHRILESDRLMGEWFACDVFHAIQAIHPTPEQLLELAERIKPRPRIRSREESRRATDEVRAKAASQASYRKRNEDEVRKRNQAYMAQYRARKAAQDLLDGKEPPKRGRPRKTPVSG